MSDGITNQSPVDAKIERDKWIDVELRKCNIDDLALALHAVQDEASESHGFKPWKGGTPGFGHLWKDTGGALGYPLLDARRKTAGLLSRFKSYCPCICE